MADALRRNERNLLRGRFDKLVHNEIVDDTIEELMDAQIRRRFGEVISAATKASPRARQHSQPHLRARVARQKKPG